MCRVGQVTGGVSHIGGIMKIMNRLAMATVAAAGLMLATTASAVADVSPHKHCLYLDSLDGYVLIAEGLSENAPNDPALENFHVKVHTGEPGKHLKIIRIDMAAECPAQIPGSIVSGN